MKKTILYIILFILIICVIVASYLFIAEIQAIVPKNAIKRCNVEEEQFMSRKVFIITPKEERKSEKVILYFHGGAYMADTTENHWTFLEKIVNETKATIIMPDYPLTPKYNYKDVFAMIRPLYKEIIEKVESKNLIIMGDSAGGGMGLALIENMAQENIELPEQAILLSLWLDTRLENKEIEEVQKRDKKLIAKTLKIAGIAYSAGDDNYLINPIDGNLNKIKNITIFTGTNDILNPDVYILEKRAKKQGITIKIIEEKEACHIWMIDKEDEKLALKTCQQIVEILKK